MRVGLSLLALCVLTVGVVGQVKGPKPPRREIRPIEELQRDPKYGTRFSLAYVPLGWKGLSASDRAFAESQAARFARRDELMRQRAFVLSKDVATMTRREVLQTFVAFQAGLWLDIEIQQRVFARADIWRKGYSATEYKWRTLAHWSLQHDLGLIPALERLGRLSSDDWRVEVTYIDSLLSDQKRQDLAIPRARALVAKHPKYIGSHLVLARTLRLRGWQRKDRTLFAQADAVLAGAKMLATNDFERGLFAEERRKLETDRKI